MAVGGFAIAGTLFFCSFISNFYLFVGLYSIVIGFGFGVIYMVALRNAWQFYPSKKGMLSGIIMSCYSVGAILWVIITKELANPHNLKPKDDHPLFPIDEEEKFYSPQSDVVANVPTMLRTLAYIYFSMIVAATLLINKRGEPPTDQEFHNQMMMDGFSSHGAMSSDRAETVISTPYSGTISPKVQRYSLQKLIKRQRPPLRKLTLRQSLEHRTFWHIFAMLLCSMAYSDFMKPQMKYYGSSKFDDDLFLSMVGIVGFVSSSLSKFAWGTVQDFLGFVKVYMITLGLQTVICFSMDFVNSS